MSQNQRHNTRSEKKEGEREQLVEGVVVETLPNTLFRVSLQQGGGHKGNTVEVSSPGVSEDEKVILAYLSGSMRLHRIRVLVGDKVLLKLDPYGGKGRITKRL